MTASVLLPTPEIYTHTHTTREYHAAFLQRSARLPGIPPLPNTAFLPFAATSMDPAGSDDSQEDRLGNSQLSWSPSELEASPVAGANGVKAAPEGTSPVWLFRHLLLSLEKLLALVSSRRVSQYLADPPASNLSWQSPCRWQQMVGKLQGAVDSRGAPGALKHSKGKPFF